MSGLLRSLALASLALLVAVPALAASTETAEVDTYGKGLSDIEIVPISELYAHPDDYVGKTVKVEGTVTAVCAKRGCWMELAGDEDFQSMRIKVQDGVIVFPMEAIGHVATAEGVFTKIELTLEQTKAMEKHRCEEAGEEYDESQVCTPASLYQIAGVGAEIR